MGVLYVSFGSKVRPRTFGCIAMGSALCIFGYRLFVYSAGTDMNRVCYILIVYFRCWHMYKPSPQYYPSRHMPSPLGHKVVMCHLIFTLSLH